jgi:hypothetical protein
LPRRVSLALFPPLLTDFWNADNRDFVNLRQVVGRAPRQPVPAWSP